MEPPFEKLKGVYAVLSGYSGGERPNPAYKDVAMGKTKHREVVQVHYDPKQISYAQLLEVYWRTFDPTDASGQFADRGSQYQAAIFYGNAEEKALAEKSKAALGKLGVFSKPILTEVLPAKPFYPAEDYHQDYAALNPTQPYIACVALPKMNKLRQYFSDLLKTG